MTVLAWIAVVVGFVTGILAVDLFMGAFTRAGTPSEHFINNLLLSLTMSLVTLFTVPAFVEVFSGRWHWFFWALSVVTALIAVVAVVVSVINGVGSMKHLTVFAVAIVVSLSATVAAVSTECDRDTDRDVSAHSIHSKPSTLRI